MKDKLILLGLSLCGFFTSVLPLAIVFWMNREKYFIDTPAKVKLALGGVIVLVFVVLKVLGKVKIPGRITTAVIVMALAYLLEALLNDLMLLTAAYLAGEILDMLFFDAPAKRLREKLQMEKQADVTAGRMEQLLSKYVGNGRV